MEKLVCLFDTERGSGTLWTLEEYNEFAPRILTEAELRSVRELRSALFRRWFELQPGQKLELNFVIA